MSGPSSESDALDEQSDPERVLIVAPTGRDATVVTNVLAEAAICAVPRLFQGVLQELQQAPPGALIVAEEALLDGGAAQLAQALRKQPAWSDLPLIVLLAQRRPGGADPALSSGLGVEGLALLLERPLRKSSLISSVRMALRARRRQYEVRDHLEEHVRTRAELEQADHAKDEFLAMLAHELRNPLAPIRNAGLLLQRLVATNPSIRQISELIARQSAHMARLLDGLLDVSRITRGRITLDRKPLNAEEIARDALETARPLMESRRHEVRLNFPSAPFWVNGDVTRLTQVLGNLLINAGKYTPAQGQITLTLEATQDEVTYRVRDNGIGIEAQLLPTIFDLFSQADTGLDRSEGGLGIGLAVVKALVEMHGGAVAARSSGQGKGSEFMVRLPRVKSPANEQADEQSIAVSAPQRILVVDDNPDLGDTVAMLLQHEGHAVCVARDGPSALQMAKEFKPNAAVLDIGLPGLSGYQLARELRSHQNGRDLLLIAVTGYGQAEDRERSRAAGFDHHMVKPVDPQLLGATIAEWANAAKANAPR